MGQKYSSIDSGSNSRILGLTLLTFGALFLLFVSAILGENIGTLARAMSDFHPFKPPGEFIASLVLACVALVLFLVCGILHVLGGVFWSQGSTKNKDTTAILEIIALICGGLAAVCCLAGGICIDVEIKVAVTFQLVAAAAMAGCSTLFASIVSLIWLKS